KPRSPRLGTAAAISGGRERVMASNCAAVILVSPMVRTTSSGLTEACASPWPDVGALAAGAEVWASARPAGDSACDHASVDRKKTAGKKNILKYDFAMTLLSSGTICSAHDKSIRELLVIFLFIKAKKGIL